MSETAMQRLPQLLYKLFVYGVGGAGVLFLILPILLTLLMSITSGQTLHFPPEGLSLHWYAALVNPAVSQTEQVAAFNSLKIAALAIVGSFLDAVPAAIGMTHVRGRAAALIEPLLLAPLVLPSLVKRNARCRARAPSCAFSRLRSPLDRTRLVEITWNGSNRISKSCSGFCVSCERRNRLTVTCSRSS